MSNTYIAYVGIAKSYGKTKRGRKSPLLPRQSRFMFNFLLQNRRMKTHSIHAALYPREENLSRISFSSAQSSSAFAFSFSDASK